jgi:hypothetical protein
MQFMQQHVPHFDAVEILVLASGALIVAALVFAM